MTTGLRRWRPARAIHDPAKIVTDLAITVALGGDCAADIAVLRAQPCVFDPVASDPTVSRANDPRATAGPDALAAIRQARAVARGCGSTPGLPPGRQNSHRPGRDPGHRPLRQGRRGQNLEEDLRLPPAAGLPRSRRRRHWGTPRGSAAPWQRRQQHRRRPRHRARRRAGTAPRSAARTRLRREGGGADAHRRRRGHPHPHPAHPHTRDGVLRRRLPAPLRHPHRTAHDPEKGLDPGLQRRRQAPRWRLAGRGHRPGRPDRLAAGHAADPAQGTPTPGEHSCASPTWMACGSPGSSPTPRPVAPAGS
jgi:hypothetical protein